MANMPPCVIGMEACVSASKRDPQRPKGVERTQFPEIEWAI